MSNKRFRWSKVYESSEEELMAYLQSRNLQAQRIVSEEFGIKSGQNSAVDFTIWCAEGSLTVRQDTTTTSLQPGDAINMRANLPYDIRAGLTGYVCYIAYSAL